MKCLCSSRFLFLFEDVPSSLSPCEKKGSSVALADNPEARNKMLFGL